MTTREQIEAAIGEARARGVEPNAVQLGADAAQRLQEEAPLVPVAIEGPSPLRALSAIWSDPVFSVVIPRAFPKVVLSPDEPAYIVGYMPRRRIRQYRQRLLSAVAKK